MKTPIVMVPMPTPCNLEGEPDEVGLGVLCDDMIDAGCGALFALSSTGRGPWFAPAQRDVITTCTVRAAAGRLPVYVGCQSSGLPIMLDYARRAAELGADGVVVTAPTYFGYSVDEMRRIFLALADRSPIPLFLYDVPMYTQTRFGEETILEMAQHHNILGMKDTTGDIDRFVRIADRVRGIPDFLLLQGNEQHLLVSLDAGGDGVVSTFAALAPQTFVALHRAWIDGDLVAAEGHQRSIRSMYELVAGWRERRPEISVLFFFVHRVLGGKYADINILLDHEKDFPLEMYQDAQRLLELCRTEQPPLHPPLTEAERRLGAAGENDK